MSSVIATISISGKVDRFNVLTDEALEGLAERMSSSEEGLLPFRNDAGDLVSATYDPESVRVVEIAPGLKVIRVDVEIPEGVELEAKPAVLSGIEVTEEDRAREMRELESRVEKQ